MNIEFSDESYLDIEDAIIWYETIRKGLSIDFELCLEAGFDEIIRSPNNFQERYSYIRIHFIKRFPYGIHFFISDEDIIRVIGIIHTSRSPQIWLDRI